MIKFFNAFAFLYIGLIARAEAVEPAPNGLTIPEGYRNWRVLGVSQRTENGTLRAILGNADAIEAARTGHTNPWPKGAIIAKVVWKQKPHADFATAMVPGDLLHTEFMFRDPEKFADTGGWGFARWIGNEREPYGKSNNFASECFGCHQGAERTNWVFTKPVILPE